MQFTHVPSLPTQGTGAASTYGAALLMSYDFGNAATPAALRLPGFKLPLRLEYIASTGDAASGAANLLYGPGSAAWSLTLTPTYQYQRFFARVELSYVGARKTAPGLAFGADGNRRGQVRGAGGGDVDVAPAAARFAGVMRRARKAKRPRNSGPLHWCRLQDSNPPPDDYKSTALPDELSRQMWCSPPFYCMPGGL